MALELGTRNAGLPKTFKEFIDRTNQYPQGMIKQLWPRFDLDPKAWKLQF